MQMTEIKRTTEIIFTDMNSGKEITRFKSDLSVQMELNAFIRSHNYKLLFMYVSPIRNSIEVGVSPLEEIVSHESLDGEKDVWTIYA